MFKAGQKVVCINSGNWDIDCHETCPCKGQILTIRDIVTSGSITGLRFNEITNRIIKYTDGTRELAFDQKHFRPIKEDWIEEVLEKAEKEYYQEEVKQYLGELAKDLKELDS